MKKRSIFAVGLALAMATPAMSATNLLTNGSFEGGFAGWGLSNVGGGSAPQVIDYLSTTPGAFGEAVLTNAVSSLSSDLVGTKLAYFSSDVATPDSLTQTVGLVLGQTYNIGFDYYVPLNGTNNPNDATLSFLVNNVAVGSTLTAGNGSLLTKTWYNFSTQFTASASAPAVFEFRFVGLGITAADFAIDRVYVQAVPEPATWMMIIFGFGLLGHAMRRRTRIGRGQSFA